MNFGETPVTSFYAKPPYSFNLLLDVLSRYAHPAADITHDGAYWRAIRIQGSMALVRGDIHHLPESQGRLYFWACGDDAVS